MSTTNEIPTVSPFLPSPTSMGPQLHNLCDLCQKVNFAALHEPDQCESLGCQYKCDKNLSGSRPFNRESVEVHSMEYLHHRDLNALHISAQSGCHLCSLVAFGLQHSGGRLDARDSYGPSRIGGVVLVFHKSSKWTEKEELEVFCDDMFTLLPVTDAPLTRCSELGFNGSNWKIGQTASKIPRFPDTGVLFYARCLRPNHPVWGHNRWNEVHGNVIDGYLRIQSYMPGQLISVYKLRGNLWLGSFVYGIPAALAAHHAGHETFGWVDGGDYVRLRKAPHPSCDCGKGVWEPPLLSMAGGGQTAYLAGDPSSETTFSQINLWISSCVNNHAICRHFDSTRLPLRVIDVGAPETATATYQDPFLSVGANRVGRYVTLSYRWGDKLTLTTTSSSFESRKASIPFDSLPQTFQDAVDVTRKLGIQYLWIDALCILQDSPTDWEEQSSIMDQIYGEAWLNISASGASDSQSGFLKRRNLLEIRSCQHPSLVSDSAGSSGAVAKIKVICPNVPRHDRILKRDMLETRGWILQERAISKRTLHFGPYEIYWECLVQSASEREPEVFEKSNSSQFDHESQNRKEDWKVIRSGVQFLRNENADELLDVLGPEGMTFPCHDEDRNRWILRNLSKVPKERNVMQMPCRHYHKQPVYAPASVTSGQVVAAHHLWYILVQEYTRRLLTKASDRLPAISGLARIFQGLFGARSQYVAGIWTGDILNGLAWRMKSTGTKEVVHRSSNFYQAPSFSWASMDGPIFFSAERRNRLTSRDSYAARLLHFESIPFGSDPLGQVSQASLTLRAYAIPFHRLSESGARSYTSPFDVEDPSLEPSDKRILCVSIRNIGGGYLSEPPHKYKQCLLLLPTGTGKDVYRRIGFLEVQVPEPPRPIIIGGIDVSQMFRSPNASERADPSVYNRPPYEGWKEMVVTVV